MKKKTILATMIMTMILVSVSGCGKDKGENTLSASVVISKDVEVSENETSIMDDSNNEILNEGDEVVASTPLTPEISPYTASNGLVHKKPVALDGDGRNEKLSEFTDQTSDIETVLGLLIPDNKDETEPVHITSRKNYKFRPYEYRPDGTIHYVGEMPFDDDSTWYSIEFSAERLKELLENPVSYVWEFCITPDYQVRISEDYLSMLYDDNGDMITDFGM